MDIRKLQRAVVDGLEEVKAQDIVVFNTEHLSPLFERVVVASGTSNRHTKALAASVRDAVRAKGMQVLRTEGQETGEWVIVDCAAVVVHIMQPIIRQYYNLEGIWGDKPVAMNRKKRAEGLVKASEDQDNKITDKPRPVAKKAPKTSAKSVTVKKTAAKKVSATKKTLVSKAPSKQVPTKKAPVKKAAAKRVMVKKAPVKRIAAKKGATRTLSSG